MKELLQKSWPDKVSKTLTYRLGLRPLHEYVKQNANHTPNHLAYSFYGKELLWKDVDESVDKFAQFLADQGVKKGIVLHYLCRIALSISLLTTGFSGLAVLSSL